MPTYILIVATICCTFLQRERNTTQECSGLMVDLERKAYSTNGQAMYVYDDPAYPLRVHL